MKDGYARLPVLELRAMAESPGGESLAIKRLALLARGPKTIFETLWPFTKWIILAFSLADIGPSGFSIHRPTFL